MGPAIGYHLKSAGTYLACPSILIYTCPASAGTEADIVTALEAEKDGYYAELDQLARSHESTPLRVLEVQLGLEYDFARVIKAVLQMVQVVLADVDLIAKWLDSGPESGVS